jgi:hypothetical protein
MSCTRKFTADEVLVSGEDFIAHEEGVDRHWTEEARKIIDLAINYLGNGLGVSISELADFFSGDADEILQTLKYGYGENNKHDLSVLSLAKDHLLGITQ